MLYVTTRNKTDSYTAYKALRDGITSDGGQFLPLQLPILSQEMLEEILELSFCDAVAQVLNMFFSVRLTGWDVEFTIGRRPLTFSTFGRKITVAEFWNNADQSMKYSMDRVYKLLCDHDVVCGEARGWGAIAIRIAFLFGAFSQLKRENITVFDIATSGYDMESVMAAWYARKMGLPIGLILCGTNENCGIWDLLYKGQLDTGAAVVATDAEAMDQVVPAGVERLICETLGLEENLVFMHHVKQKHVYRVPDEQRNLLSAGLFSSVVGKKRVKDLINSVYQTNGYFIDPYMAISYGTLQDYRSKTGENRMTLMISEAAPVKYAQIIASATGLSESQIRKA